MAEIKEWRSTVLACKNSDEENFQDVAGDSYYAWTHALAVVMFGSGDSKSDQIGKFISEHATTIIARRFVKQSIPSDHKIAAAYGNAIGNAILASIKKR